MTSPKCRLAGFPRHEEVQIKFLHELKFIFAFSKKKKDEEEIGIIFCCLSEIILKKSEFEGSLLLWHVLRFI